MLPGTVFKAGGGLEGGNMFVLSELFSLRDGEGRRPLHGFPPSQKSRKTSEEKKMLTFGQCPKVALTPLPPPVLDTLGVTLLDNVQK